MKILAYLTTYNRYDTTLFSAWLSLIQQTRKPDKIIIYDNNPEPKDPTKIEHLNYLFEMCHQKGIDIWYDYAKQKGAHFNHERANMEGFDAAYFIDDDNFAEPNVLEELEKLMVDGVGAVGGLILKPPATPLPSHITGKLSDIWHGENIAWHTQTGEPREVEHLYSGFLYRCNIVHHDLRLSKKVFRGETMFTHSMFLKGYKLIFTPKVTTWHFEGAGGCRSEEQEKTNSEMYNHDSFIFQEWLKFKHYGKKLYFLNEGLGDNYAFKQVITPETDAIVATCYPYLFPNNKVISIGEAEQLVDKKDFSLYAWMERNKWSGDLRSAYKKLYEDTY